MRIKGLVRVFNHVRAQLQAGLKPDDVEPFKRMVETIVRDVEELCRKHGMSPNQLPGPSRLAYKFLKDLDLNNLPVNHDGEPAAAAPTFRIRNVVKIGEQFAERIWQQLDSLISSPDARYKLEREMSEQASAIEQICARHSQTPSVLEPPSRQVYCWLKFLGSEENLTLHLEALQRAREAVSQYQRSGRSLHIHMFSLNALWRKREYRNAALIKINEGFLSAERRVWEAIAQNAFSERNQESDLLIREFAASDEFSETLFEIESFAAQATTLARGRVHDLDESFARVNAAYFEGRIAKPSLVWNRTLTARKFGHYQPARDTLMISVSLDDPKVPAYVVDFVMYHELLHKKHGVMTVNGRRLAHSPEFRADERRFAEHREAEQRLNELALRQRGLIGL
jgi:predicted metal-dependent hydrolase